MSDWILPCLLLVGFLIVMALLFGQRLLPAKLVSVAPVITIRNDRAQSEAEISPTPISQSSPDLNWPTGKFIFQASGWVEPDPYPIAVPTLVGGIVDEVFILEGAEVKKDQQLARLVDDDAKLDLQEAQARVATLESEIEADQARIPFVESKWAGSTSQLSSEKARLAELEDRLQRLKSLPSGSIPAIELASTQLKVSQYFLLPHPHNDLVNCWPGSDRSHPGRVKYALRSLCLANQGTGNLTIDWLLTLGDFYFLGSGVITRYPYGNTRSNDPGIIFFRRTYRSIFHWHVPPRFESPGDFHWTRGWYTFGNRRNYPSRLAHPFSIFTQSITLELIH